jgi:nitroimidazol reductase NimA-like FMN-containing flavoprotein (pyridoxamine 5'-phosphate oxidase superfamily)
VGVVLSVAALRHLTRDECVALLCGQGLGRVSVSIGALPAILPVNYVLWDESIVFRSAPGTKLSAALMGSVVGFEVDAVSDDHSGGWSVLVVGHATEIRDTATLEAVRRLPLEAWAPGTRDLFVRIPTEHITGRAFGPVDTTANAS